MNLLRLTVLLGLLAVLAARAGEKEQNAWPLLVRRPSADGKSETKQSLGPLLFEHPAENDSKIAGFRPFYVRTTDAKGLTTEATVLYPIFFYRSDGEITRWSVLDLINRSGHAAGQPAPLGQAQENFDVWPFWFSRQTDSPESSYRALFPIAGTIKDRFGLDQVSWGLWPLYMQSQAQGATTTSTPWPIIRATRGSEQGFAFWPLFGWRTKPGVFDRHYYLWPLIWNNTVHANADAPAGTTPAKQLGFLPFYTRDERPGFINENFGWPFFGYTAQTAPTRYHETRYLWPFLVQGHGDDREVNRWGPFYTNSVIKGVDKTWVLWPLFREATWTDAGIIQTKTQLFYFFYWSLDQRSASRPALPHASKTHVWPLFSDWDNGAGHRQFQAFSPFEIFFPDNDRVRQSWTPLFALYRYDERAPDNVRHDLLWGAVTWRREGDRREFHLGPLLSVNSQARQKRIALGNGLLGFERRADTGRWRFFWFDFPSDSAQTKVTSR